MLGGACALSLAFVQVATVRGPVVRLGELADLGTLPASVAKRARQVPVLRLAPGVTQASIRRSELAAQAQSRLPMLAGCFDVTGDPVILRSKVVGAEPEVRTSNPAGIIKGAEIVVRIEAGMFTIERSGLAASDAKPGSHLFVRTAGGEVIRAVVSGGLQ